ncbi:MAG: hypothetical protein RBR86_05200 [Pseudobdellovibrionaceae bacterium]|jgi:hypothetical protein|nr:hypothetical protein [Pseudobdellovibrionaceae bacterium]
MALSPLGEFKVKLAVSSLVGLFAVSAMPEGSGMISTLRELRNTAISQLFNPSFYRQHDKAQADALRASVALGSVDDAFHARCELKMRAEFPDVFKEVEVTTSSLGLGRFTNKCALAEAAYDAKTLENRSSLGSGFYTLRAGGDAFFNTLGLNGIPFVLTYGLMSVFFSAGRKRREATAEEDELSNTSPKVVDHDDVPEGRSELFGHARPPSGASHHR